MPWGLSIQDYLTNPVLKKKMPQIQTNHKGKTELALKYMKVNNLSGLQNILNIGTVQIIRLSDNQLTTIQTNAFADLPKLTDLNLSNNQLKDIPPNAFAGLTKLEWLNLGNNQLNEQAKKAIRKALPGVQIDFRIVPNK